MYSENKKNSVLVIRVDDDMKSCLDRLAYNNCVSVGHFVRKIISAYFASCGLGRCTSRHD